MSKLIEKLAASGQLTPEQVERIGRSVADFNRRCNEDPEFRKEAAAAMGFGQSVRGMLPQVLAGAAAATASAGLQAVGGMAVESIRSSLTRSRDYKKMMDVNPHLADHDAKEVQKIFGTLHKFNPQYASDPSVAGAFVKETLESERMNIGSLNQIVRARSDLANATRRQHMDLTRFIHPTDPMAERRMQLEEQRAQPPQPSTTQTLYERARAYNEAQRAGMSHREIQQALVPPP